MWEAKEAELAKAALAVNKAEVGFAPCSRSPRARLAFMKGMRAGKDRGQCMRAPSRCGCLLQNEVKIANQAAQNVKSHALTVLELKASAQQ